MRAIRGRVVVQRDFSAGLVLDLNYRTKKEKQMAHLYEKIDYPYPGNEEAMKEFIAKGGMIGMEMGSKGLIEKDDSHNFQKEWQDKKLEQEAMRLWLRMGNDVSSELQEKWFEFE